MNVVIHFKTIDILVANGSHLYLC